MAILSAVGRATLLRVAAIAAVAMVAAGCTDLSLVQTSPATPSVAEMYAAVSDDGFDVPAVSPSQIDPRYVRRVVTLPSSIPSEPGTIVVDPQGRYLYYVQAGGTAIRYGIGVGREGFAWSGTATIKRKEHWPTWTPPREMVARDPRAAPYAKGMPGGLDNPLGARAMYLYQGKQDTLYRIHGTNEPGSIGQAVSSGCIRLVNQDVKDLYERTPIGTKVIVLPAETINAPVADMFDQLFGTAPPTPAVPVGKKT